MALPTNYSCVSAAALALLTFAAMQVFRESLSLEGKMTILGGFMGSCFFVFLLTAVGNAGTLVLGKNYQTRLFPEVIACLVASVLVSALVHRVCATTCLLFSLLALYFINRISHSTHSHPSPPTKAPPSKAASSKSPSGKNKSKQG